MGKEHWNEQHFESFNWIGYITVFERLPKGRQTAVTMATHNMWHTGVKHQQYYRCFKPCCMCNCETEEWLHGMPCGLLDSAIQRAASLAKLRKSMDHGHLPADLWTTVEKSIHHYIITQSTVLSTRKLPKTAKPRLPFGVTFTISRNLMQQAYRTQYC
jgi:hypothetical protein